MNADMQALLIEIGTEELPVKALPGLAQALFDGVIDGLVKRGVALDRDGAKPLYTPRRLAVLLPAVASEQPEQASELLGPYVNVGLDADGQPTRALQGFAQKAGVDWTQLARVADNKGERFVHRSVRAGATLHALLPELLQDAIAAMPIPRPMRWGDHDYAFARPVHWLVALHGREVVAFERFGLVTGRNSRGHRFLHDKPVWIGSAGDYIDTLRAARVLVDPDERREHIVRAVEHAAQASSGVARIDADNLEQVNCLVEWPSAVACSFDRDFLQVPQEALVATMETNQKFFPVLDAGGRLTEHFVGIANIESNDVAEVRKGYERVIRPRFADAGFFYDEDIKQGLESMNAALSGVTYQAKLGTIADKVSRVAMLARSIAGDVGVDPDLAERAARLGKADLQSRLVNEFPELQGIAGRYYAVTGGEARDVADAIEEAYMPRFAGDRIAPSRLGQVLAIAERLDTLAGGFAAGLKPTGNKDPFALRRNALGLARTLIEGDIDLDIDRVLIKAVGPAQIGELFSKVLADQRLEADKLKSDGLKCSGSPTGPEMIAAAAASSIRDFIVDRMRGYYVDAGFSQQQFDAVTLTPDVRSLRDFDARLNAIAEFAKLPEADALAAANKRIRNILRKADGAIPTAPDPTLFEPGAEQALAEAVELAITDTNDALDRRDYVAVLGRLARLRPQVDAFFDAVMVNVDNAKIRNNRLALLQRLADRLGSVAAIEHLSGS